MSRIGIIIIGSIFIFSIQNYAQKTKILFIGNSYTYTNDLPITLKNLALCLGDTIVYDQSTPGGYRLIDHASNATTLSKIKAENWDFVVIQAQSQEPSWPPSQLESEVYPYAAILNDSIKSNFECTEVVFFMTWGRKYGDSQNCSSSPPVCTFSGMQERLVAGYMTMAERNRSTIAPVGLAWKYCMDNDTDSLINLFSSDNSHPSISGTFLTACVLYAVIFKKNPIYASYSSSLNQQTASFLKNISNEVVLGTNYSYTFNDNYTGTNYYLTKNDWYKNGHLIVPNYNYIINNNTVSFNNETINGTDYIWDFGDGTFSTDVSPIHTYSTNSEYIVSLSISNSCYNEFIKDTINILTSAINGNIRSVSFYPIPANFYIDIKFDQPASGTCHILNILGQETAKFTLNNQMEYRIDISNLNTGQYILQYIDNTGHTKFFKIIKI
ncbi:MAG: T9SS type A sorting domain-containing protein [Bacteroidales bacterium]|nr:T9SS type A sorting domain-containing protein [Bacteroidales bacterium]